MDDAEFTYCTLPNYLVRPLFDVSGSPILDEALNLLIETAKTNDGRSQLASAGIIETVIQLCKLVSCPLRQDLLLITLRLLRNLCAGDSDNQILFIELSGVGLLYEIVGSLGLPDESGKGILRMVLQVLGNVSLGGEEQQRAVWRHFFSSGFHEIARVRSKETCDPLCMVLYTCSVGSNRLYAELKSDPGLEIVKEIIRTSTLAGFKEEWLKWLLSRICLEDTCFSSILYELSPNSDYTMSGVTNFGAEHTLLLSILSEETRKRVGDKVVASDFAISILGVFSFAVKIADFTTRANSELPTGSPNIDVMGYSLSILRDICANEENDGPINTLVLNGLIELLVTLLRDLEPPALIKKAMAQSEGENENSYTVGKFCPYKGFRRDIIATIGNCCYRRKSVQDKLRDVDGIVLLLQNSVIDEENPFLREWGLWATHNVLEGNAENMKFVADLELKGTVDVPELTQMGLRVEVDPKSQRAKLVNQT